MSKISACLVVYNEEKNIARCLASLAGAVDEIILIHDGECQDQTLKIAAGYNARIFTRPHVGMMEAHLVFALKQASGDWLLRIDADEFLTIDLKNNLRELVEAATLDGVSAYSFFWTDFDSTTGKLAKSGERKTILFKKADLYWLSLPHLAWQTRGRVRANNFTLGHVVKNQTWSSWWTAQKSWAKIQAAYLLKDFSELEVFQADRADFNKFYAFSRRQAKNPFWPPIKFVKALLEELINGHGFKKAVRRALYNFLLGYYLYVFAHRR
ncbi:MAG: glycosyltransferase [Patescibacteria group bacterium]